LRNWHRITSRVSSSWAKAQLRIYKGLNKELDGPFMCQCECGCTCTKVSNEEWEVVSPETDQGDHVFTEDEFLDEDMEDEPDHHVDPLWAADNNRPKYYIVCQRCAPNFGVGSDHACHRGPGQCN
jgi:hypothetical protein